MLELTAHRGPDSSGLMCDSNVALGVNRLSIVAPEDTSLIPTSRLKNGYLYALFNGEIVNYKGLQKEVDSSHMFGDTSTIIPLYLKYGASFIHKLAGMFAIAIYDERKKRLDLWRDPLGIKPLYYYATKERVIFSSEIKAIYSALGQKPGLEFAPIDHILTMRFHPGISTPFNGIQRVLPGQHVVITENGVSSEFYWNAKDFLPSEESAIADQVELNEEFRSLLTTVLREYLQADTYGGFFVSGGLDSSLLFSFATQISSPYKTGISLSFDPSVEDERHLKNLERYLQKDVHRVSLTSEAARQAMEKLIWYQDEPLENPIHVGTYLMAEKARELGIKTVITGDGSDEFFLGYERHEPWFTSVTDKNSQWLKWLWSLSLAERKELYSPDVLGEIKPILDFEGRDIHTINTFSEAILFEQQERMPEYHCMRLDRMTMAQGVEARVPFLDHRIVEFVQQLPFNLRYGSSGKGWLKAFSEPHLPTDIIKRPKTHFPSLPDLWLKDDGSRWAADILLASNAKTRDYFRRGTIERYIKEHQEGKVLRGRQLWGCIALELWLNNNWL